MRVYNLTDATPPYQPRRKEKVLKIRNIPINPGKGADVPDSVPIAEFSGWMHSLMVSVDSIPDWYPAAQEAEKALREEEAKAKKAAAAPKPAPKPAPTKSEKKAEKPLTKKSSSKKYKKRSDD